MPRGAVRRFSPARGGASGLALLLLLLLVTWLLHLRELLREHLLHALLLLDQERADDAVADAAGAPRAAVGAVHGPLALLQCAQHHGANTREPDEGLATVAALRALRLLLERVQDKLATRRPERPLFVALGVVADVAAVGQALNHCD